jgi:transcriptional regulator with XRE-family HTH domain
VSARVRLAGRLIEARLEAGLSQASLADEARLSPTSLSRFEDADRVPSEQSLTGLASALETHDVVLPLPLLLEIRAEAALENKSVLEEPPGRQLPDPSQVSTAAELAHFLKAVHIWAGAPSYRSLERRTAELRRLESRSGSRVYEAGPFLSKSAIGSMLKGTKIPSYENYRMFLQACGVRNVEPSVLAWQRCKIGETSEVRKVESV